MDKVKKTGCNSDYNPAIHYEDFEDVGNYIGNTGKIFISPTKKLRNIYPLLYENANIIRAQYNAQKGKGDRTEIKRFNDNLNDNLADLYDMLRDETYKPGEYRVKIIYEPKERVIMIAPFYPDRIIHHCIINVLGKHWYHIFTSNTYACIKGRGIHKCMEDVHRALITDRAGTRYCLKIDIRKFYDNVDHSVLKRIIRYTIADDQMLRLLDKIIDSNGKAKGLPIGNFTSQYLANLYLAYFDHWVEIKPNWQIFPVDDRSIDYVGFRQNHYGILLRKGILLRFYEKLEKTQKKYEIKDEDDIKHLFPSEYGWIVRCSKEHSSFIFNKCLRNGEKQCFDYRPDLKGSACSYRRSQKRSRHHSLQP